MITGFASAPETGWPIPALAPLALALVSFVCDVDPLPPTLKALLKENAGVCALEEFPPFDSEGPPPPADIFGIADIPGSILFPFDVS